MEDNRMDDLMKLIGDHFSSANDADMKLAWTLLKGESFDDANRAIEEDHKAQGARAWRPNLKNIGTLAAGYRRSRASMRRADVKRVVAFRSYNPIEYQNESDMQVIRLHIESCWRNLQAKAVDGKGIAIARALMMSSAKHAMMEIGIDEQEADDAAHMFVGLEPGQKIPQQGIWQVKYESKSSFQALTELAKAEYGKVPGITAA